MRSERRESNYEHIVVCLTCTVLVAAKISDEFRRLIRKTVVAPSIGLDGCISLPYVVGEIRWQSSGR